MVSCLPLSDFYLAKAYPFLYARKYRYFFLKTHVIESIQIFYGTLGFHFVMIVALALAIVGSYRTNARCDQFKDPESKLGIFATQPWPQTCLIQSGAVVSDFSDLSKFDTKTMTLMPTR